MGGIRNYLDIPPQDELISGKSQVKFGGKDHRILGENFFFFGFNINSVE